MAQPASILSVAAYSPHVYNALGEIEDVDREVAAEQILGLGRILLKYGYESSLAVIKAHRHFALADTEAMLETPLDDEAGGGDGSIARPEKLSRIVELKAKPSVLALAAMCDRDAASNGHSHCWFPVQYATGSAHVAGATVWNDEQFLRECADYLVKRSLADKLLLATRRRRSDDGAPLVLYLEMNRAATRTSEMRPLSGGVKPANAIETTLTFHWSSDGSGAVMVPAMNCLYCCVEDDEFTHSGDMQHM